jgi:hypothetical protein
MLQGLELDKSKKIFLSHATQKLTHPSQSHVSDDDAGCAALALRMKPNQCAQNSRPSTYVAIINNANSKFQPF